jgi:pimeloyl-ACP methyl ester carboxylesterase
MFWVSVRDVKNNQFTDEASRLGATRYLHIPDRVKPSPSHAIRLKDWLAKLMATFPKDARGRQTGDLVVFVHGYNNTVDYVAARQKLIAAGLKKTGFNCTVMSFDWPSGNTALGYLEDRHDAKITAMRLVNDAIRVMLRAQTADCMINIHVLAHSMGAYVVREAFDDADDSVAANQNWSINQLVYVAGDVSSSSLSNGNASTESLFRHCYRLTNYFSGYDEPLQVSNLKRVGLSPRVGRVGLPMDAPPKGLDVDCSARYQQLEAAGELGGVIGDPTHSWYFHDDRWYVDLAQALRGKIDRNQIAGRAPVSGAPNDFRLA